MKRQLKGYGAYLIILGIILVLSLVHQNIKSNPSSNYEYSNFLEDIAYNNVTEVKIYQNQQTPTGNAVATLKDKSTEKFNVADVGQLQQILNDKIVKDGGKDLSYHLYNVSKPSWILTLLPYVLGFIVIILLFSYLTNQAAGGRL